MNQLPDLDKFSNYTSFKEAIDSFCKMHEDTQGPTPEHVLASLYIGGMVMLNCIWAQQGKGLTSLEKEVDALLDTNSCVIRKGDSHVAH